MAQGWAESRTVLCTMDLMGISRPDPIRGGTSRGVPSRPSPCPREAPPRPSQALGHRPWWAPVLSSCSLQASSALTSPAWHGTPVQTLTVLGRPRRAPILPRAPPSSALPLPPGCACPSMCLNPGLLQLLRGPTQSPGPRCVASAAVPGPEGPVSILAMGRRGAWWPARPSP